MAWLCTDQVHAHTPHALTSLPTLFPMLRLQMLTLSHMPQLFSQKPWSRMPWCASLACLPSEPKSTTVMMMSMLLDVSASHACVASALAEPASRHRIHMLVPISNKTKQTFFGPWSVIDVNILMV